MTNIQLMVIQCIFLSNFDITTINTYYEIMRDVNVLIFDDTRVPKPQEVTSKIQLF